MNVIAYEAIAVIVMSALDYITGVVNAIMHSELSSKKMREGLGHKFAYLVTFFLGWFIDFTMDHINLGFTVALTPLVSAGIILIELSSIVENLGKINPELQASKVLQIFKKDEQ